MVLGVISWDDYSSNSDNVWKVIQSHEMLKDFLYQGNLYTIEIVHEWEDVTLHLNVFWLDGQVLILIFLFHFFFNILSFSIYFPLNALACYKRIQSNVAYRSKTEKNFDFEFTFRLL